MYQEKDFDFSKYWAFFAFWDKQFEEAKEEWLTISDYVDVNMGWLIAKKSNYKEMLKAFKEHAENEKNKSKKKTS